MNILGTKITLIAVTLLAALYPLLVYVGLNTLGLVFLAGVLWLLACLRVVLTGPDRQAKHFLLLIVISLLCLLAVVSQQLLYLQFYPVIMNLAVAGLFAYSLTQEQTVIEKMALRYRPHNADQPHVLRYLRKLTLAWAILLTGNACIALYTALFTSTQTWALYNGLISYAVMAAFVLLELVVRHFYRASWHKAAGKG